MVHNNIKNNASNTVYPVELWGVYYEYKRENVLQHSEIHCKQVSFKKEVGVMVIDLVFWLTVRLILKMCY